MKASVGPAAAWKVKAGKFVAFGAEIGARFKGGIEKGRWPITGAISGELFAEAKKVGKVKISAHAGYKQYLRGLNAPATPKLDVTDIRDWKNVIGWERGPMKMSIVEDWEFGFELHPPGYVGVEASVNLYEFLDFISAAVESEWDPIRD